MPRGNKTAVTKQLEAAHEESEESVVDSEDYDSTGSDDENEDDDDDDEEEDDDEFEDQGSSSEDDDGENLDDSEGSDTEAFNNSVVVDAESVQRDWSTGKQRSTAINSDTNKSMLSIQKFLHVDDLSSDDENGEENTVGRVPLHWYDAYDHIGYNIEGEKVMKQIGKDAIDNALANRDSGNGQRTVFDMYNNREVVLSERDIEIIRRIQAGAFAHPEHNDTPDYIDYFSSIKEVMPISAAPEPRRRFVPSKWEMMKVTKIIKAIKEGRYVMLKDRNKPKDVETVHQIWNEAEDEVLAESSKHRFHLPAPKLALPGHAESYNPPQEYLLTNDEKKQMNAQDPSDRKYNFIPKKHECLRHVGGYDNFIKERFERCLDLYLCPRKLKRRLNIDPETLIPRLPKPRELKPYPNTLCMQFLGHSKGVNCIAVSPDGQYLVSGSDDCTVRLWEVDTTLCRAIWTMNDAVTSISWNPNSSHHMIAVSAGPSVVLISLGTGDKDSSDILESFLLSLSNSKENDNEEDYQDDSDEEDKPKKVSDKNGGDGNRWVRCAPPPTAVLVHGYETGPRFQWVCEAPVKQAVWHHRGDYLAILAPSLGAKAVSVHQVSKGKTQYPFKKSPGNLQCIAFHPSRPFLFLATQQSVKVFNLIEQKLVKKLMSGCKWISTMDIHHSGDHVIIGSYDRRVVWFDLDLSSTPYKTLKFHEKAVRSLEFHRRYPLMASASDDGTVHVFHSTVYSDLSQNPLVVPLKVLRGHGVKGGLGVLNVAFHPRQPWIFSSGADGVVNLYQDI